MKIAFVIGTLSGIGGAEKVLLHKVEALKKKGYEVSILVDNISQGLAYEFNNKIKIHKVPYEKYNKNILFPKQYIKKAYNDILDKLMPDLIIVVQRCNIEFILKSIKYPIIREFHSSKKGVYKDLESYSKIGRVVKKIEIDKIFRNFKYYDRLILLTESDKKNGHYNTKTQVIPNFIPDFIPDFNSINNEYRTVISVGSMRASGKRFELQIEMWKTISKKFPNWKLNIYGDGIEREKLQRIINSYNLNTSVFLKGNTLDINEKYKESDFFIFTSRFEGFPMVLIEAMSNGLPCISFDINEGPNEIITNNQDGFLVEDNNIELFIEKIEYLILNVDARNEMKINAIKKALKYQESKIIPIWEDFYKEILNEK